MKIFEKFAAMLFLILLIGMIGFLTFVPVPDESKQVILIIIGGLMTTAATSLPKLFGEDDGEKARLAAENIDLNERLALLEQKYLTLETAHNRLTEMLVMRHVVDGHGFVIQAPEPEAL